MSQLPEKNPPDSYSAHGRCRGPVSERWCNAVWSGSHWPEVLLTSVGAAAHPPPNSLSTPRWEQHVQNTPNSGDMACPLSLSLSLCTRSSCSFIANWTFHSERNNYSQEKGGLPRNADMTCNVTLPLKTQGANAPPAQSLEKNRTRKRENICLCVCQWEWYRSVWIFKGHFNTEMKKTRGASREKADRE